MKKIVLLLLIVGLSSCDYFLCGRLDTDLQKMVDTANSTFENYLEIEKVPCEFFYINVLLKTEKVDTNKIHSVHQILYDEKNNLGWNVLVVYDINGKFIFEHSNEGNISLVKSEW